jgi:DNA-binding GntR family transcriptional regulator
MQLGSAQAPHVQAREARLHEAPLREDRIVQAYEKLRDLIVWGRLAPGTRIIESDVAGRLGISRTPVRSALQRLQQEGYILALDSGKPQAERYNRLYTTVLVGEIHTSVDEHESIIQSIAEGRPNEADQAAEINFRNAAERLSKVIGNVGERGSW